MSDDVSSVLPTSKARQKIGVKVALLTSVVVTAIMILVGSLEFVYEKQKITHSQQNRVKRLEARIETTVGKALWDVQTDGVAKILTAEMANEEVNGLAIIADQKLVSGLVRDANQTDKLNAIEALEKFPSDEESIKFDINYVDNGKKNIVGKGILQLSHHLVKAELKELMIASVIKIIVIDVVLVLAVLLMIQVLIMRPILKVRQAMAQVTQGDADLTVRLSYDKNDELGDIVNNFNAFSERLQHIIKNIQHSTADLSKAADEAKFISENTYHAIEQQRRESEQIMGNVHGAVAEVNAISSHAMQALNSTTHIDSEAKNSKQIIESTVISINQLEQQVSEGANVISSLAEDVLQIAQVLQVIQEITAQTNLLALNAAIEAARAGEQGKGFAVVADEVRKLATRTQDSTQDIQTKIQQLESSTIMAVSAIKSGQDKAKQGLMQVDQLGGNIQEVSAAVANVVDLNRNISDAASGQNSALSSINHNVRNLNLLIQETSLSASKHESASDDLTRLASQLNELVGQFKV